MKKFLIFNILGILLFFVIAIVILMLSLRSCTRHGEKVTIPTVVGLNVDEAIALIESEDFEYEIIDTLAIDSLPKGCVVEQVPAKESLVKHGRKIFMKINTSEDIYVIMPDFKDAQFKTLHIQLQNAKLKMGNIRYKKVEDYTNIVLEQMYNGRPIAPGTQVKQGSRIDFVIAGKDPNSEEDYNIDDSNSSENEETDDFNN